MTFVFLSYQVVVDKSNFDKLMDNSTKIPVFFMIHSPYCHHCTAVHPFFEQVMKEYASDPKVILADVNGAEYGTLAHSIFDYSGFPTFGQLIHRKGTENRLKRTVESFRNYSDYLKSLDMNISCPRFDNPTYPAVVVYDTDEFSACTIMKKIGADYVSVSNESETELKIHYQKDTFITFAGDIGNIAEARLFMQEKKLVPLTDFLVKNTVSTRKLALLVAEKDHFKFREPVANISDFYAVARVNYKQYQEKYQYPLSIADLPAFFVVKCGSVGVIKHVTGEQIKEIRKTKLPMTKDRFFKGGEMARFVALSLTGYVIAAILVLTVVLYVRQSHVPKAE